MKINHVLFLLFGYCLLIGSQSSCTQDNKSRGTCKMYAMSLYVGNNSSKTLFDASILSDNWREDFGVLGIGSGATIGFGRYRGESHLRVIWVIKGEKITHETHFSLTQEIIEKLEQTKRLEFIFLPDHQWRMRLLKDEFSKTETVLAEVNSDPVLK